MPRHVPHIKRNTRSRLRRRDTYGNMSSHLTPPPLSLLPPPYPLLPVHVPVHSHPRVGGNRLIDSGSLCGLSLRLG